MRPDPPCGSRLRRSRATPLVLPLLRHCSSSKDITRCVILKSKCKRWYVMASKLSRLTPCTNRRAADARIDIHALGCWVRGGVVNRTQSLILASLQNKSTANMRVRKRNCTPVGCKKSNNALLFHWFLLTPEGWQLTATGIVVDWLKKKKGS